MNPYQMRFSLLCLLAILCSPVFAQRATISGIVSDQSGGVIAGATITAVKLDQGLKREAVTNDEGYFAIPLLQPGVYTITAQREGFTPTEIKDVALNVGDERSLRIQLKVAAIGVSVTLIPDANTIREDSAVATVIDRQFVENIPLNGRSFQTLIALTPGTVIAKTDASNPGQFSVNGQRANANYLTIDGVSANIGVSASGALFQESGGGIQGLSAAGGFNNLVSVDAMQEFRVQTSTYAPEFGRTPGAQISIVTRSGTNAFHGAIFEYFRNDALDANDWFANRAGLPQPPLRQNQFGGVMGGPIIKNRTFFFFSYEGLRLRLPQTMIGTLVPSLAARQAAPPGIQPLLNAYPVPNGVVFPDGTAEFSTTYSDPSSLNATSIRIDQAVSGKLQVFGRYANSPSRTEQRTGSLSSLSETGFKTQTLTLGATWVITPRLTNDLRANYSRNQGENFFEIDSFGGAAPPPDSALFPTSRSRQDSLFDLGFFSGSPTSLLIRSCCGELAAPIQCGEQYFARHRRPSF